MPADFEHQVRKLYQDLRTREDINRDQADALNDLLGGGDVRLVCKGSELAYSIAANMVFELLQNMTNIRVAV